MRIIQRQGGGYQKGIPGFEVSIDAPLPTMCATQANQFALMGEYFCQRDEGQTMTSDPGKRPYRVPTMAEVTAIPWNGLTVASLFAGAGGSSTGYRMAGYRVLWASEFVPAAQDSYRANMREGTILDGRDVRLVQPAEVLAAAGLKAGELDVLDGSPPCQAFSTAGKRAKGWGQDKTYEHGAKQKNEDLFQEYVRILRGLMPRTFVAENVAGLVKGVAKGYFLEILADLKASGYRVEARLLDAQWLGVPQTRSRVIFVGVRDDLGLAPAFPSPLPYRYSMREAIPWLCGINLGAHGFMPDRQLNGTAPAPAIAATGMTSFKYEVVSIEGAKRKFTIAEVKRLCSFSDDYVLTGSYAQQWARLGNSVPPLMMRAIAEVIRDKVLSPARAMPRLLPKRFRSVSDSRLS